MKNGLDESDKKVKLLYEAWQSPSATNIINYYFQIKDKGGTMIYQVFDQFVILLKQMIGEGYEIVEEGNKNLASLFK